MTDVKQNELNLIYPLTKQEARKKLKDEQPWIRSNQRYKIMRYRHSRKYLVSYGYVGDGYIEDFGYLAGIEMYIKLAKIIKADGAISLSKVKKLLKKGE